MHVCINHAAVAITLLAAAAAPAQAGQPTTFTIVSDDPDVAIPLAMDVNDGQSPVAPSSWGDVKSRLHAR